MINLCFLYIGLNLVLGRSPLFGYSAALENSVQYDNEITSNNSSCDIFCPEIDNNASSCNPNNYHDFATDICQYTKCCCDGVIDGLVNYINFEYCTMKKSQAGGIVVLIVLLVYAFIILKALAEDYFAPIMAEMSETLHLSHNVAGVTFLAFGNGAPDISSSISALTHGGKQTELGLGALLGAGVFVPIVVCGVISLVCTQPKVARRPFVRDCFFLFISALYLFIICYDHKISLVEAISMWIIYILYVLVVVLGEVHKKWKRKKRKLRNDRKKEKPFAEKYFMPALSVFSSESMKNVLNAGNIQTINDNDRISPKDSISSSNLLTTTSSILSDGLNSQVSIPQIYYLKKQMRDEKRKQSTASSKKRGSVSTYDSSSAASLIEPENDEDDSPTSTFKKITEYLIKGPTILVDVLCKISIPLTDKGGWNDYYAILSCICGPIFILFGFDCLTITITFGKIKIELWEITLGIGILLAIITAILVRKKYQNQEFQHVQGYENPNPIPNLNNNNDDNNDKKSQPVMKIFFLFLGFGSACAWIDLIADELVNILTTLGIISQIDLGILGLTVLAWGNSVGDMLADVSVSRRGYAKMGIAAAIGGPTLNILLGVGIAMTIKTVSTGKNVDVPLTGTIFISDVSVLVGLFILFIVVFMSRWKLYKLFGYFCLAFYFVFILANILSLLKVFHIPGTTSG